MLELLKAAVAGPVAMGCLAVAMTTSTGALAQSSGKQRQPPAAQTPSAAAAADLKVTSTVWCDKADQMESLMRAHYIEGLSIRAAIDKTNIAASDPSACMPISAITTEGRETRRFIAGNNLLAITEYKIHGVVQRGRPVRIKPLTWYAAKVVAVLTQL